MLIERVLNALFFIFGALSVIWFGYKFIKNQDIKNESATTKYKTYYKITNIYFIFVILMMISYSLEAIYECIDIIADANSWIIHYILNQSNKLLVFFFIM